MSKTAKTWPERVKALQEKYDLTQQELADRLEVSRAFIGMIVIGQREPTGPMKLLFAMMEKGNELVIS